MSSELILDALVAPTAVAGVACLAAVAARRAPAALRNTLWRIALVGLWVAPVIVIATHAAPWQPHTIAVPLLPAAQEAARAMPPGSNLTTTPASLSPTSTMPQQPTPPERTPLTRHVRPASLLLLLWAAGAALGMIYLLRDLRDVRLLILAHQPLDDPTLQHRVTALAGEVGLRSSPAVAASPAITTPTVAGLSAPVLLLPEDFSSAPASYDAVIVHELAHIRRRDLAFMLAARLTRAFWWWHPLAWLMARELVLSAEEACDDWAVAVTGRREDYATTLVDWAEAAMPVPGLPCAPRGRALVRRVQRILQSTQVPRLHLSWQAHTILALCAIAMVVLVGTVHVRAVPADGTATHPILLAQAGEEAAQPQTGHTITVQGKVLGPDGQPLAEAQVLVQYNGPDWEYQIQTAVTKADGGFSFRCEVVNLTRRMCVAAHKPTLAVDWAPLLPGDEDMTLRLTADPVAFAGTVKDPEGNPIAGARAHISCLARPAGERPANTRFANDPHADEFLRTYFFPKDENFLHATTDEAGRFEIPDLPAEARVRLTVLAEGRERLHMQDETIPAGTRDFEVVLRPEAVISGRIIHDGHGVGGIQVLCTTQGTLNAKTISAEDGTYKFDKLRSGTYDIPVDAPEGLTAASSGPISLAPGEIAADMNVVLTPGGLVKGTVTDGDTGQPLAAVRVNARAPHKSSGAKTGANGNYVLRIPPGLYQLSFHTGYLSPYAAAEPRGRTVNVVEGETTSNMDFVLYPQRNLRGKVVWPDGSPVAGVGVAVPGVSHGPTFEEHFTVKTDASGDFELKLQRGEFLRGWSVLACDPERGLAGERLMPEGRPPTAPVQIKLAQGGYITGRVLDTDGNPLSDIPVGIALCGVGLRAGVTDKEGHVRIGPLPAGLEVRLSAAGKFRNLATSFRGENCTIVAGRQHQLQPIVLDLKGRTIQGWVADENQRPVRNAFVFASGLDDPARSDDQGNFKLTGLPTSGKVWVIAMHATERLFAAENIDPDWDYQPGMVLRPPVSATGRIVEENGQPIRGARLRGYPEFPITWDTDGGGARYSSYLWENDVRRRLGQRDYFLHPVTDADGKWHVDGLIPGAQYVFWIEELADGTEGHQPYQFITEPDKTTDAGEIVIE